MAFTIEKLVPFLLIRRGNSACLNMILNGDDHCKNFSFMVIPSSNGKWKWTLAPAYDLTMNAEGYNGEHATSVNGTGNPKMTDFIEVGKKIRLSETRCRQLIEEVADNCGGLIRYNLK